MSTKQNTKTSAVAHKAISFATKNRPNEDIQYVVSRKTTLFDYHFQVTTRLLENEIAQMLAVRLIPMTISERKNKGINPDTQWYVNAIQWFEHLVENYGLPDKNEHNQRYIFMCRLFDSLSLEQKAILQKGYDIHYRRSSPTLNLDLLQVELEENFPRKSSLEFPVRAKRNSTIH